VGDHVIDTNVLLIASALHPGSPFKDSNVPAEQQQVVFDWLMEFRKNGQRKMVLDQSLKIWEEYHNKMTRGQDIGSLVIAEKLQFARFVEIAYDKDGHGCLPEKLEEVVDDRADRKLVAVALTDVDQGEQSSIVNASDTDWYRWENALNQAGVVVEQVIDDWCRGIWEEKKKKEKKASKHRG
jgi:hypothetical protein